MRETWLGYLSEASESASKEVLLIFYVASFFLAGGIVFILNLFASRIFKSRRHKRESFLRSCFQKILNKVVVNATFSEDNAPDAAFEFYMAELRFITGTSTFSRQVLLNQILDMKKSLTGASAKALLKTYYAMHLYNESLRKLQALKWEKKALAIRELAEMGHRKSVPLIKKYLCARNPTLQEESLMALIRLDNEPLSFLDDYHGELSLWMRINIHRYLQSLDPKSLPSFSRLFNHSNLSVRLFSIEMARQFRETSALASLSELLYSDNARVVALAMDAIGELEASQYRDQIIRLASHVWRFEKLSIGVIKCLNKIGDKEADTRLVGKFLLHPCYTVRFAAVDALKKFGPAGESFVSRFNNENDRSVDGILRHLSDPLLG